MTRPERLVPFEPAEDPRGFLFQRRGPWPEPSPHAGWRLPPAVLDLPSEEVLEFMTHVGKRVAWQTYVDPALRLRAYLHGGATLEPVSDARFVGLLSRNVFSRFLNPTLDPWDRERFADLIDPTPGRWWKVDFTGMEVVTPFPGMHVAPTVTLLRKDGEHFTPVAIAIGRPVGAYGPQAEFTYTVVRPVDPAWELTKYFALQGASNHLILSIHPRLHFPMDAVNGISKAVLPKDHVLLQLLLPHCRFTLGLDKGVLERADMVLGDDDERPTVRLRPAGEHDPGLGADLAALIGRADRVVDDLLGDDDETSLRAPFVAPKEQLFGLIVLGYEGVVGNSSYPAYTYPTPPEPVHSVYGEHLERYYAAVEAFVAEVCAFVAVERARGDQAAAALAVSRGWLEGDAAAALQEQAEARGVDLSRIYAEHLAREERWAPEQVRALSLEARSERQAEMAARHGWLSAARVAELRPQARDAQRTLAVEAGAAGHLSAAHVAWLERLDEDGEHVRRWAGYLSDNVKGFPADGPDLFRELSLGRRRRDGRDYLVEVIARFIWDVSVAHSADHWSLGQQISLREAPLRLRVPAPASPAERGFERPSDLVTRGDLARSWFANEVFFRPNTVTRLQDLEHDFGASPLAPELQAAQGRFLQGLQATEAAIPPGELAPLEELAASIQDQSRVGVVLGMSRGMCGVRRGARGGASSMCYSKEVSLAVGGFIAVNVGLAAWRFLNEPHPLPTEDAALRRDRPQVAGAAGTVGDAALHVAAAVDPRRWAAGVAALRGFQADVLKGLACIALHQLFEFLAIASGDVRVYKLGLLCSLSCMVFLLRSLERLEGRPGRPETALAVASVVALGVTMAPLDMHFVDERFWVRGYSHALWSVTWLVAFLYWNLRVRDAARRSESPVNARLLGRSCWYVLDASFALSVLYMYGSALSLTLSTGAQDRWAWLASCLLLGHDVYADAPSVWCVFAALQALLVWPLFRSLRSWRADAGFQPERARGTRRVVMLALAAGSTLALCWVPLVLDAAAKMVTR